jgi:hypothetical protein
MFSFSFQEVTSKYLICNKTHSFLQVLFLQDVLNDGLRMGNAVFDKKLSGIESSADYPCKVHSRDIGLLVGLIVAGLSLFVQAELDTKLVQEAKVGFVSSQGKHPIVGYPNFPFWG